MRLLQQKQRGRELQKSSDEISPFREPSQNARIKPCSFGGGFIGLGRDGEFLGIRFNSSNKHFDFSETKPERKNKIFLGGGG